MAPAKIAAPKKTPPSSSKGIDQEALRKKIHDLFQEVENGGISLEKLKDFIATLASNNANLADNLTEFSGLIAKANKERDEAVAAKVKLQNEADDVLKAHTKEKGRLLGQVKELQEKNASLEGDLNIKSDLLQKANSVAMSAKENAEKQKLAFDQQYQSLAADTNQKINDAKAEGLKMANERAQESARLTRALQEKEKEIADLKHSLEEKQELNSPDVVSAKNLKDNILPIVAGVSIVLLVLTLCMILVNASDALIKRSFVQPPPSPIAVITPALPSASVQGMKAGMIPPRVEVKVTLPSTTPTLESTPIPRREVVITYPQYVTPPKEAPVAPQPVYRPRSKPVVRSVAPAVPQEQPVAEQTIDPLVQQRQVLEAQQSLEAYTKKEKQGE